MDAKATKTDGESKEISRLASSGKELEAGLLNVEYRRLGHLRERINKTIDSASQRVAVLRKEFDATK